MATVKLVASTYTRSNSNYVTVTNPSYMYDDTSDTSDYATIRGRAGRSSNSTYYCYLHGFNFSAVPSNATVTGFTVKIKGYRNSYQNTGSSYRVRLCGSATNSAIASTTTSTDWDTTVQTITIPTGSLTWSDITGYGSGFSIQLRLRNNQTSSSYYPYLYIYGAEIEVTYTVPVEYTISASSSVSGVTIEPSSQTVYEGDSASVRLNTNQGIVVKDNGTDVTSQLTQDTDPGYSYSVTNITTIYGFFLNSNDYYESNNKAHANSAAVCRVDFHLEAAATITFSIINYAESTYDYGLFSNVDTTLNTNASADSSNVYWNGKNNNSSSVQTVTYTGVTAGDHYIYVKYFKDTATDSYNDSLQFKVAVTITGSYTPTTYYAYSIANVQGNHTIAVTSPTVTYSVTASTSVSGWQVPVFNGNFQQTSQIEAGDTAYVLISGDDYTGLSVTDNGVDVTSSLVYNDSGSAPFYLYQISNVQEAHVIVASRGATSPVRVKQNGSWVTARKVLVKQNGNWVEGTIKVKQNGNWN